MNSALIWISTKDWCRCFGSFLLVEETDLALVLSGGRAGSEISVLNFLSVPEVDEEVDGCEDDSNLAFRVFSFDSRNSDSLIKSHNCVNM